jgi:hypothetical protein
VVGRHEMKPYQALVGDDDKDVVIVSVGGPRSILEAMPVRKSAEIEFGRKRYDVAAQKQSGASCTIGRAGCSCPAIDVVLPK